MKHCRVGEPAPGDGREPAATPGAVDSVDKVLAEAIGLRSI